MKIKLPYILLALMLISCGRNRTAGVGVASDPVEEIDFFVFDLENGIAEDPKATTLNELTDSISFIPLETRREAMLPNLHYEFGKIGGDMFILGGHFMAGNKASPIYQFDSLGRFVKQVIHYGRGPNEISLISDWYANPNLKQINVIDANKMLIVQTDSGEKSTVILNSLQGRSKVPLNDSTFVSVQSLSYKDIPNTYLYFIDRAGSLVHSIERNDELSSYNTTNTSFSEYANPSPYDKYWLAPDYKGDAIFHDIFNDTLYRIKSHSEITPHLVFKRGALSPRPEDKQKPEKKKKQVYFIGVMESGDYVFLNYTFGDQDWCDVWSKRDGSLIIHTPKRYGFFFDVYLPFVLPDDTTIELRAVYADRDNIYCVLEALDAIKFMPGIKEDDNPIIMVAKLKK